MNTFVKLIKKIFVNTLFVFNQYYGEVGDYKNAHCPLQCCERAENCYKSEETRPKKSKPLENTIVKLCKKNKTSLKL